MKKGRIWGSVGYPESLPSDWLDRLQETGLQIAISPLHDKDLDPTGEPKKAHYHVLINYDGPTTHNHVKELCTSLNMVNPIKLESLRGMFRYHIHQDNPEKYQYNDSERILLNGFDRNAVNELTRTEINKYKKELIIFIEDNNIMEYSDLLKVLIDNDMGQLFEVASSNTMLFSSYLCSKRNKLKESI